VFAHERLTVGNPECSSSRHIQAHLLNWQQRFLWLSPNRCSQ
jgi:hypothetical protein